MYFLQDTSIDRWGIFLWKGADNGCAKEMLMVLQGSDAQTKSEAQSSAKNDEKQKSIMKYGETFSVSRCIK